MYIQAEDLKHWLMECETEEQLLVKGGAPLGEEELNPIVLWENVILLVQTIWDTGEIPQQ